MIYPDYTFIEHYPESQTMINADPDFLVQLLDKIIHNATGFSTPSNPISLSIQVTNQGQKVELSIENKGPLLMASDKQDLFQSMVSIRPTSQQHDTHLGLGLYIAKMIAEYHQAELSIANNADLTGVAVSITFPLIIQ